MLSNVLRRRSADRRPGYETYEPPSVSGGGASALASRVAQLLTQVAFLILTARLMEPEGRGFYALAATTVILCGLPLGSVWAANAIEMRRGESPSKLLGASIVIAAVGGVATAGLALLIALPIGSELWVIAFPALMTPFVLSARYSEGMFQSLGHVGAVNRIILARAVLPLAFIAPPLFLGMSTEAAIFFWALSFVALAVVSFYGLPSFVGGITLPRATEIFKRVIRGAGRLAIASGALLILAQIAIIALAIFRDEAEVGVYSVAVAAGAILGVATSALELSAFRRISAGERTDSVNLCARSVRHALVLTVGGAAVLVPFLAVTLDLIVGPGYEEVPLLLVVLLPGIALMEATRPIDSFFTVQLGRIEIVVRLALLMLAIVIPTTFIFVPLFGAVGAALAVSLSTGIGAIAYFWYFMRTAQVKATDLVPGTSELADYHALGLRALDHAFPRGRRERRTDARPFTKPTTILSGRWRLLGGCVLLGVAAGLAFTLTQPTRYATTTTLVLSPSSGALDPANAVHLPRLAETVSALATSEAVIDDARGRYVTDAVASEQARRASEATPEWIEQNVTSSIPVETSLVEIEATGPSQAAASSLSAAVAAGVIAQVRGLDGEGQEGLQITVFGPGDEKGQVSPTPARNLLIGLNLGIAMGVVLLLLMARRPRLTSQEELATALEGPVLLVPAAESRRRATRLASTGVRLDEAEMRSGDLHVLAAMVDAERDEGGSSLAVVGPVPPWAIRSLAIEIAGYLSARGRTTVVIEADPYGEPWTIDGEQPAEGIAEAIDDGWAWNALTIPVRSSSSESAYGDSELSLVPIGMRALGRGDPLTSAGFLDLIRNLERDHDHVIIAGPTADHEIDSVALTRAAGRSVVALPAAIADDQVLALAAAPEARQGTCLAFIRLGPS